MRYWIVAYDISDDERRADVAKILEGYGLRIQYSVFEGYVDEKDVVQMQDDLAAAIDPEEDKIIYFPLCEFCRKNIQRMGQQGETIVDDDIFIV